MIIKKTRIRNLDHYLHFVPAGEKVVFGYKIDRIPDPVLTRMGFPENLLVGQTILPAPLFGPTSRFNAEGRFEVHKDQPMETAYRQTEWHWQEWRGRYDSEDQSRIVDVPYRRYPRTFIPPPAIELMVSQIAGEELAIVSPPIALISENERTALHIVNLFLEIFGECEIYSEKLENIFKVQVRRLNWEILPRGHRPWSQLKSEVESILSTMPGGTKTVVEYRLETINKYNPEFLAIGRAGFRGYVIFGFPAINIFVLESIYFGNATYVFTDAWEELSKKTKAEILNESLQKDRIIHRENWESRVRSLLG